MPPRVLITGDTGLLGRQCALRLHGEHEVTGLSRSEGFDITRWETLGRLCDAHFDVIVHCAAAFEDDSIEGWLTNEATNSLGTLQVCRLALATGCRRILLVSTVFAHDGPENAHLNAYGLSKLHGEQNCARFCDQSGIGLGILRFGPLYDSNGSGEKHQRLLYSLIRDVRAGRDVTLWGTRDATRNYLHVEDAAEVVRRALDNVRRGMLTCVSPETVRLTELVRLIASAAGTSPQVRWLPEKGDIPDVYAPYDTASYRAIAFAPQVSLAEGLRRLVARLR